jgi:diguanylate cyclase (GGDEF)-like protein/PAS domain S-box-containing protein
MARPNSILAAPIASHEEAARSDPRLAIDGHRFAEPESGPTAKGNSERLIKANMILLTALNNMRRGLSMFGPDQNLIICNKQYREMYDLPAELCRPGTPLQDIIRFFVERDLGHPAGEKDLSEQKKWIEDHVKRLAGQEYYCHEQRLNDGRIVLVTYEPLPGGGWVDLQEDVTAQRLSDSSLRLAAAVFTGTQEGIVITDPQGLVVTVNPAYSQITGYTSDDLVGQNLRVIQSGRHGPEFYKTMWRTIREEGHWQGEIWNKRRNGQIYPALLTVSPVRDDDGEIDNYVGTLTDMTRLKRTEVELDHLAHHDVLTDLPNRLLLSAHLDQALARAVRHEQSGAVLFLDLDDFKAVNDSLGHIVGDEVLVAVAQRLKDRLRASDMVARIGGDEFVIVLEQIEPSSAAAVAQELIDTLRRPFPMPSQQDVRIGATVGISQFPKDGQDAGTLIKRADIALYEAKGAGRGTYHVYCDAGTAPPSD